MQQACLSVRLGIWVLWTIRAMDYSYHVWTIRTMDYSVPWTIPRTFVLIDR